MYTRKRLFSFSPRLLCSTRRWSFADAWTCNPGCHADGWSSLHYQPSTSTSGSSLTLSTGGGPWKLQKFTRNTTTKKLFAERKTRRRQSIETTRYLDDIALVLSAWKPFFRIFLPSETVDVPRDNFSASSSCLMRTGNAARELIAITRRTFRQKLRWA